ncbi:MAG: GGDEF domain-containing protein, partial [Lachnospiraceae bacterium]
EIKKAQKEEGEYNSNPIEIRMQDGCSEWYRFVIYTLKNEKNTDTQMIGKIVNAQKEVEEQRQMLDRVRRDPLTNLYNREGFEKRYEQINVENSFAYAVMDLDNFKSVNDELGHDGGDRALLLLAETMQKVFDENTIFCRYGGDEFVLCVYDMSRERVEQRMERLVKDMDCRMDYFGKPKQLSISMGAIFTNRKLPQETAFRLADEVLYRVKEHGKNNWCMENIASVPDEK